MEAFGNKFTARGKLCEICRGITSGCGACFMSRDITVDALERFESPREFRREYGVDRQTVVSGHLKIVKAGDGSLHPIESEFLAPEVHSLMTVDRPLVRSKDVDRVVLLVNRPKKALLGSYIIRDIEYGQSQYFALKHHKASPRSQQSP